MRLQYDRTRRRLVLVDKCQRFREICCIEFSALKMEAAYSSETLDP
jgi:hypothetical protein